VKRRRAAQLDRLQHTSVAATDPERHHVITDDALTSPAFIQKEAASLRHSIVGA
jgi:hypothetical protein